VNVIRLHKFTDTVKKHKHKFEDKYEYLSIAETMINQMYDKGNKYFFVYADIDEEKIYGGFTNQDMENAVDHFIEQNYKLLVNPLLNARDMNGNKKYEPAAAMVEVKQRLMNYKK
jgi:hypothetical protein